MREVTIRNASGQPINTVPCHGVRIHLESHYLDLALHYWRDGSRWCVTDPLSGIRLFTFDWTSGDVAGAKVVARYKIGKMITGEEGDLIDRLYEYRQRMIDKMGEQK